MVFPFPKPTRYQLIGTRVSLDHQRQHGTLLLVVLQEGSVDDTGELRDLFLRQRELKLELPDEHEQERLHPKRNYNPPSAR